MMTTAGDIYDFIDSWAPFSTALDYDNVGLLVGNETIEVKKVLLALDITPAVVLEAQKDEAQLIVSHHPVIFTPLKKLDFCSVPCLLTKAGIGAICAHTNLDLAQGGVNTCLAKALKVQNCEPLALCNGLPYAMIGTIKDAIFPAAFAQHVRQSLDCEGVRYLEGNRAVHTVALCCGAGGDMIFEAIEKKADAFITGEIKHHELVAAAQAQITVVDAGHFKTENIVIQPLLERLQSRFGQVEFKIAQSGTDAVRYL